MSNGQMYKGRAVILTAIQVEYDAVRRHLMSPREETYRGTVYERGKFRGGKWQWDVGIGQIGAGNIASAAAVERAVTHFNPEVMLFVGVAGGVKDVTIGDVVAVTKACGYESGKVADEGFLARPEVGMSSYRLVERAKVEARKAGWRQRIRGVERLVSVPAPKAFVGPIAAGEKVIASTHSELFQFLRSHYNDTLAVEMEGRGFLEAARANDHVQALIIRAISDLLDGKSTYDSQGSQEIAASHAAAFAFEILAQLDIELAKEEETASEQTQPREPSQQFKTNIRGNVGVLAQGNYQTIHVSQGSDLAEIRRPIEGAVDKLFKGTKEPRLNSGTFKRSGDEAAEVPSRVLARAFASMPVEIYFSYVWEDENLVRQLQNQLAALQRQGQIVDWSRHKITAGQVVDAEITKHLNAASIILLFISPDYIASNVCNQEMERALRRQEALVIPILLHPVAGLKDAPFAHLQIFPRDGRSISEWGNRKGSAFAKIADEITAVVKKL